MLQSQISVLKSQISEVQNSIGVKEQEITAKQNEIARKEQEIADQWDDFKSHMARDAGAAGRRQRRHAPVCERSVRASDLQ